MIEDDKVPCPKCGVTPELVSLEDSDIKAHYKSWLPLDEIYYCDSCDYYYWAYGREAKDIETVVQLNKNYVQSHVDDIVDKYGVEKVLDALMKNAMED